jgi:hypothetical protein
VLFDERREPCTGFVGALKLVEVERDLNLGAALERGIRGNAREGFDREFRLLQRLVQVAKREQRNGMSRV